MLVFVEHHGSELQKGALGVLTKAASLGDADVAAVLVGGGVKALASERGKFGAGKVFVAEERCVRAAAAAGARRRAREDRAGARLRHDADRELGARGGHRVRPCRAARCRAQLGSRRHRAATARVGKRPALQDSVYVDVGWKSTPRIALFRAGSFDASATGGGEPEIVDVTVDARRAFAAGEGDGAGARGVERPVDRGRRHRRRRRARPRRAREVLARRRAGACARRRGRRDTGRCRCRLVPVRGADRPDRQGRVAEALRRARHLRRDPAQGRHAELNVIVSINKDANAPIFEFSDLGVVGDVNEIVPKLTELIKQRKGS